MGTLPDHLFPRCAGLGRPFTVAVNTSTTACAVIPVPNKV
jgi:hypothetical protein